LPDWYRRAKVGAFITMGPFNAASYAYPAKSACMTYMNCSCAPPDISSCFDTLPSFLGSWYCHPGPNRDALAAAWGSNFTYRTFVEAWSLAQWDPAAWAADFRAAGFRYSFVTAKYTDGFANYNSSVRSYNSVRLGPKLDVVGEFIDAMRNEGLAAGIYHSTDEAQGDCGWGCGEGIADYTCLSQTNFTRYVDEIFQPMMREIVEKYEPDIFWSDLGFDHDATQWRSPEFLAWLYNRADVIAKVWWRARGGETHALSTLGMRGATAAATSFRVRQTLSWCQSLSRAPSTRMALG
jgi:alpha-L-fucosidase